MTEPRTMSDAELGEIRERPWHSYAKEPPIAAGVYEWRVPSASLAGAFVVFHAHLRMRGAGCASVLSPAFDYWDGYRLHIPAGTQWRDPDPLAKCEPHQYAGVSIEGISHCACIYCGKTPKLCGVQTGSDGRGVIVGGKPHELNRWWLECCEWGKTPHLSDPREIEAIRTKALLSHLAAGEVERKRLVEAADEVCGFIDMGEARAMAVDGPVSNTLKMLTQRECEQFERALGRLYSARQALAATKG